MDISLIDGCLNGPKTNVAIANVVDPLNTSPLVKITWTPSFEGNSRIENGIVYADIPSSFTKAILELKQIQLDGTYYTKTMELTLCSEYEPCLLVSPCSHLLLSISSEDIYAIYLGREKIKFFTQKLDGKYYTYIQTPKKRDCYHGAIYTCNKIKYFTLIVK